jgi:hypothetical protein
MGVVRRVSIVDGARMLDAPRDSAGLFRGRYF